VFFKKQLIVFFVIPNSLFGILMIFRKNTIVLPKNYKPTHFKDEKCLPTETPLKVSEVGK